MIEINGIKYEQIERSRSKALGGRMGAMLIMMAATMTMNTSGRGGKEGPPEVDIVEEFALIQQKKSKLSKAHRDWVEI